MMNDCRLFEGFREGGDFAFKGGGAAGDLGCDLVGIHHDIVPTAATGLITYADLEGPDA
jgi:hypothetical protein